MLIVGLDPGLARTGWGVIKADAARLGFVACGTLESNPAEELPVRLAQLFEALQHMMERFEPHHAAVEETVVNKNARSSLLLGQARGAVLLAPSLKRIPVFEYGAKKVKKALTGNGNAEKEQVAHMVSRFLPKADIKGPDAFDALAVAICHSHIHQVEQRITRASLGAPVG